MTTFEWLKLESERAILKLRTVNNQQEYDLIIRQINELRGRLNSHIREVRRQNYEGSFGRQDEG